MRPWRRRDGGSCRAYRGSGRIFGSFGASWRESPGDRAGGLFGRADRPQRPAGEHRHGDGGHDARWNKALAIARRSTGCAQLAATGRTDPTSSASRPIARRCAGCFQCFEGISPVVFQLAVGPPRRGIIGLASPHAQVPLLTGRGLRETLQCGPRERSERLILAAISRRITRPRRAW